MYRLRNKQKYFTLHYCGKVKAEAASPGHKKLPQIHTDSLSLTQVLHKRKIFFKLFGGKENANERKESLLSICRVQLFFCKDTTFPLNFQGFRGKNT